MVRVVAAALVAASVLLAVEPLRFQPRHIVQKIPDAKDVRERINSAIRDFVASRANDGLNLTPEESAKHFVGEYHKLLPEQKAPGMHWFVYKTVNVLRAAPPVISLEGFAESYYGGAYPRS